MPIKDLACCPGVCLRVRFARCQWWCLHATAVNLLVDGRAQRYVREQRSVVKATGQRSKFVKGRQFLTEQTVGSYPPIVVGFP